MGERSRRFIAIHSAPTRDPRRCARTNKFVAETAPGVGKFTVVVVLELAGTHRVVHLGVKDLKEICAKGRKEQVQIPADGINAAETVIEFATETKQQSEPKPQSSAPMPSGAQK